VIKKVESALSNLDNPVIACFGLTFKPDIDDLRESPALSIALEIGRRNMGQLLLVEPNIDALPSVFASVPNVRMTSSEEAMAAADVLVLLVDHREFKSMKDVISGHPRVIDTRGLLG